MHSPELVAGLCARRRELRVGAQPELVLLIASAKLADLARPEGVGRALATYRVPIEGRDEWIAAAAMHLA